MAWDLSACAVSVAKQSASIATRGPDVSESVRKIRLTKLAYAYFTHVLYSDFTVVYAVNMRNMRHSVRVLLSLLVNKSLTKPDVTVREVMYEGTSARACPELKCSVIQDWRASFRCSAKQTLRKFRVHPIRKSKVTSDQKSLIERNYFIFRRMTECLD